MGGANWSLLWFVGTRPWVGTDNSVTDVLQNSRGGGGGQSGGVVVWWWSHLEDDGGGDEVGNSVETGNGSAQHSISKRLLLPTLVQQFV